MIVQLDEPEVPETPTPLAEDTSCQDEVDEVNAALENWDGDPFIKNGKLYGQDYDKIKVPPFLLFLWGKNFVLKGFGVSWLIGGISLSTAITCEFERKVLDSCTFSRLSVRSWE